MSATVPSQYSKASDFKYTFCSHSVIRRAKVLLHKGVGGRGFSEFMVESHPLGEALAHCPGLTAAWWEEYLQH